MGREEAEAGIIDWSWSARGGGFHGGFLCIVASDSLTCPGLVVSLGPTKDQGEGRRHSPPPNPNAPCRKMRERKPGRAKERP